MQLFAFGVHPDCEVNNRDHLGQFRGLDGSAQQITYGAQAYIADCQYGHQQDNRRKHERQDQGAPCMVVDTRTDKSQHDSQGEPQDLPDEHMHRVVINGQ